MRLRERRARGRPAGWACGGPSLRPGSLRRGDPGLDPRPGSGRRPSGTSRRCGCGERRVEGRRGPRPGGLSFRPGFHGRARGRKPAAPRAGPRRGGRRGEWTGARLRPPGGVGSPAASAPPAAGPPVAAHAGARVAPARAATRAVWPGPPRPSCRGVWTTRPRRPRCRARVRDVSWRFLPPDDPLGPGPPIAAFGSAGRPGDPPGICAVSAARSPGSVIVARLTSTLRANLPARPELPALTAPGPTAGAAPAAASAAAGREPTASGGSPVSLPGGSVSVGEHGHGPVGSLPIRLVGSPGFAGTSTIAATDHGWWGVRTSREPRPSPPPTTAGRPGAPPVLPPRLPERTIPAGSRDPGGTSRLLYHVRLGVSPALARFVLWF